MLDEVLTQCARVPNGAPSVASGIEAINSSQVGMKRHVAAIDRAVVDAKASEDFSLIEPILQRFIKELNLASVSPLLLFDVARLGAPGVRYETRQSVGAGLRVTLVGTVDLTMSYAANLRRRSGEPSGAFLMEMRIRDLF